MFRSATFKLTIYYLLIISAISLCFSGVLYKVGHDDLAYGLRRQTQRLSTDFPVFSGSRYLHTDVEMQAADQRLLLRLAIFNVLVLLTAGFTSYALARRTLQPIEAAHQRQKRFVADVSHELRTPLTALQIEAEVALLDANASKSVLRQVLGSNVEETKKLTSLLETLLHLSRLDDNAAHLPLQSVNMLTAVKSALGEVRPQATAKHITLVPPGGTQQALTNPSAIQQLLVILLDNAIKYSPPNTSVAVTFENESQQPAIVITDQGQGIAKADLAQVFERFYRADNARSSQTVSGFGLGLAIAKQLADSQQAVIELTSQLGKGTTARLTLQPAVARTSPT